MKRAPQIHLSDVQAVYAGPEGQLWELLMGEQIHIGGLQSSTGSGRRADIWRGPARDGPVLLPGRGHAVPASVPECGAHDRRGRHADDAGPGASRRSPRRVWPTRFRFVEANVCATGLPGGQADFVWGEDAWCYVEDKPKLIAEAARLVEAERAASRSPIGWKDRPG